MKKNYFLYPILGFTLLLSAVACRKSATTDVQSQTTTPPPTMTQDSVPLVAKVDTQQAKKVPLPQVPLEGCSLLPIYGDTIIYPQPTSGADYIVTPVNSPGSGKYFSWPVGMVIDSVTGAIDLTKSQTGMRYAIGFVENGTTDTCLSQLIVGGADYIDSVYVLASGSNTAYPYYDANPYLASVCAGNGCSFDVTGSAASQKVIVNKTTGAIDLKKTLNGTGLLGGAFGILPLNGQSFTTTIYYKLNDPSNNALQHIDVQIAYYNSKSLIGTGLLGNLGTELDNLLNFQLLSTTFNPRPPLIIIVRSLQAGPITSILPL
jgi:hypothetical protein